MTNVSNYFLSSVLTFDKLEFDVNLTISQLGSSKSIGRDKNDKRGSNKQPTVLFVF